MLKSSDLPLDYGDYVLEERLAVGGTSEVFVARPKRGDSPAERLVVKRLIPSLRGDKAAHEMLKREALLHRCCQHPNIVECYGTIKVAQEFALLMEWVQGGDLYKLLRKSPGVRRCISIPLATHIAREVLAALEYAHQAVNDDGTPLQLIHRDVSPPNIYLSSKGDIKLGDFGVARAPKVRSRSGIGEQIVGKVAYLSPEVICSEPIDLRSDLFSLTSVLAEMILGRALFQGRSAVDIMLAIRDVRLDGLMTPAADGTRVPSVLLQVLRKGLARKPEERFASAAAMFAQLGPFALRDRQEARRQVAELVESHIPFIPALASTNEVQALSLDANSTTEIATADLALQLESIDVEDMDRKTAVFSPPPTMVRKTDGPVLGPFTYAKLLELLATGNLSLDDEIDFMGSGFQPIRANAELARHVVMKKGRKESESAPASILRTRATSAADVPGAIAEALLRVMTERLSGVLSVERSGVRKDLFLQQGQLKHTLSTDAQELLGEFLVRKSLVDRADLDLALAVLPRFEGRLGEALTTLGIVEPVVLFQAIQMQGLERVTDVFSWSEVAISLRQPSWPSIEMPLELTIPQVLEAGVLHLFPDDLVQARYRKLLNHRLVLRHDSQPLRAANWSESVQAVLNTAEQTPSVREMLHRANAFSVTVHQAARAIETAVISKMIALEP